MLKIIDGNRAVYQKNEGLYLTNFCGNEKLEKLEEIESCLTCTFARLKCCDESSKCSTELAGVTTDNDRINALFAR